VVEEEEEEEDADERLTPPTLVPRPAKEFAAGLY
jgi:hypothetical protein